jgi:hypothetical protein
MIFIYIKLQGSLFWFEWAQDHQNQSPDAQVMVVLVSAVFAVSRAGDSGLGGPDTSAQNVFSPFSSGVFARNLQEPLPGRRLQLSRIFGWCSS